MGVGKTIKEVTFWQSSRFSLLRPLHCNVQFMLCIVNSMNQKLLSYWNIVITIDTANYYDDYT